MTSDFFQVVCPDDYWFARYSRRGTWTPSPSPGVCPECGMTRQRRVPPLILEWEAGSDIIGDFSWGAFNSEIVAKRTVGEVLAAACSGIRLEPVKMIEDAGDRSRAPSSRQTAKRVSLPYTGAELCELWIDVWMSLDEEASRVEMERECSTCGFRFYRPKKEGLVLAQVPDRDFFRLEQFPSWVFCTDRAKDLVAAKQWSNIAFRNVR
jgi:hypothetical protein